MIIKRINWKQFLSTKLSLFLLCSCKYVCCHLKWAMWMVNCLSINQKRRKIFKRILCGQVWVLSFSLSIILHAPLKTKWQLKRSKNVLQKYITKKCIKNIEKKENNTANKDIKENFFLNCNCQSIYQWNNSIKFKHLRQQQQ